MRAEMRSRATHRRHVEDNGRGDGVVEVHGSTTLVLSFGLGLRAGSASPPAGM